MRVRIDAARHDELAGGINHSRVRAGLKSRADLRDRFSDDANIRRADAIGVHDATTANYEFPAWLSRCAQHSVVERDARAPDGQGTECFPTRE
jgi:hypothetical protein